MIPQTLGLLFKATVERFPKKEAVGFKQGGRYRWSTWQEFGAKVNSIAAAFLKKGLGPGDRIAILSENRPDWAATDLAAQSVGMITVPIYPSLTSAEIQYILQDSGAKVVAVSNKELLAKVIPIQKKLKDLLFIVGFDTSLSLEKMELGVKLVTMKELEKEIVEPALLKERLAAVRPEDLCSIIYTSGTTGVPKGVMLRHSGFIENVLACETALRMSSRDVHLSFLPLCHVFERMAGHYLMIRIGARIAYAESLDTVPQNLIEVRPTFLLGVPRFYEKTRDRVLEAIKAAPASKQKLFFWAKSLGERKRTGRGAGLFFIIQRVVAEKLVYKKFRRRLGGWLRFCVSGGAALSIEIAEFFHDLGVMIYEGYGLTETSPVITVNREGKFKFGTVGVPIECAQVKITDDGEIITAGPCVMKGYWNKPAETQDVLSGGWFHTGDLGRIDAEGFLAITGRKKELIVTSGGKKVSPRPIEESIEGDPYILRCVLFGEGRKFLTALIVPRREPLLEFAKAAKIAFKDYAELLKDEKIYRFLEEHIATTCRDLANFEKVKYFALIENDFSQSDGELTPTLKVKRETVLVKHKETLARFYVD